MFANIFSSIIVLVIEVQHFFHSKIKTNHYKIFFYYQFFEK